MVGPGILLVCLLFLAIFDRCGGSGPGPEVRSNVVSSVAGFCWRLKPDGAVAQLGEHLLCKQGVSGSIPLSSTKVLVLIAGGPVSCLWRKMVCIVSDWEAGACSAYIVKRRCVWTLILWIGVSISTIVVGVFFGMPLWRSAGLMLPDRASPDSSREAGLKIWRKRTARRGSNKATKSNTSMASDWLGCKR